MNYFFILKSEEYLAQKYFLKWFYFNLMFFLLQNSSVADIICNRYHNRVLIESMLTVAGVCHVCSQHGDQSRDGCLLDESLQWERRRGSGYGCGNAGCLLYSSCRSGESTGKGSPLVLGCTHLLGTGWSFCCKFCF